MSKTEKKYKLAVCIGLQWEKIQPNPSDTCDFCQGPVYNDGYWRARTLRTSFALLACKDCANAAGLEW